MKEPAHHVVVDGYNVIHAWPELKSAMRFGYAAACKRLIEAVRVLHDMEGLRVTVVFDGNGDAINIERPNKELTFSVIYAAAGVSADTVIERIVCNSNGKYVTVVTADASIMNVAKTRGARTMSPFELVDWLKVMTERQSRYLTREKSQKMPHFE